MVIWPGSSWGPRRGSGSRRGADICRGRRSPLFFGPQLIRETKNSVQSNLRNQGGHRSRSCEGLHQRPAPAGGDVRRSFAPEPRVPPVDQAGGDLGADHVSTQKDILDQYPYLAPYDMRSALNCTACRSEEVEMPLPAKGGAPRQESSASAVGFSGSSRRQLHNPGLCVSMGWSGGC